MSLPNFFPYLYLFFFVVFLSIWHSSFPFVKSPASTSFLNVNQCSPSSYHWPFFSLPTCVLTLSSISTELTYLMMPNTYLLGRSYVYVLIFPSVWRDITLYWHNWPVSTFPCLMGKLEREKLNIFIQIPSSPFPLFGERCSQGDHFYLLEGNSICSYGGRPAQALHCLILELVLWSPLATAINYSCSWILDLSLIKVMFKYISALVILIFKWIKIKEIKIFSILNPLSFRNILCKNLAFRILF